MKGALMKRFGFYRATTLAVLLVVVTGPQVVHAEEKATGPSSARTHRVEIPLEDGEVDVGRLLQSLAKGVGLSDVDARGAVDLDVRVDGTTGKTVLEALRRTTQGVVRFERSEDKLALVVHRDKLRENEKEVRQALKAFLERWLDGAIERARRRYGLFAARRDGRVPLEKADPPDHVVVLVHGLDDPGTVWVDLVPFLREAGHTPYRFRYPDDQAIRESADRLGKALRRLRDAGTDRVSLVGHSMGGLVARATVAAEEHYASDGDGGEALPAVERLIMLGTPNHGTPMAHLRFFLEIREQLEETVRGEGRPLGPILDGTGAAKVNLLPRSDFLRRLNGQPRPKGVKMTIVAGRASPFDRGELADMADAMSETLPDAAAPWIGRVEELAAKAARGVGDGIVPLASTRLEGVEDHVVVDANHVSMIRKDAGGGDEPAPAIPIILDRLHSDRAGRRSP